jgi:hypothetical protein
MVRRMASYIEAIKELERERNALDQARRAAFLTKNQSALKRRDWERANEKYRNHLSAHDQQIDACFGCTPDSITPDLRDFMFDYIRVDPRFYRSGYIMERILQRIKRPPISVEEKRVIQKLLLHRTKVKALRNFRQICRLIPMIEDAPLRAEIEELTQSQDPSIRHRAKFALSYFLR